MAEREVTYTELRADYYRYVNLSSEAHKAGKRSLAASYNAMATRRKKQAEAVKHRGR